MLKTFIAGIVLGVAGIIAALAYTPVVDLSREVSIVAVSPNGGNTETFHINVPEDRLMLGSGSSEDALPPGMVWPRDDALQGARTELFKLRNSRDAVIGLGSRIAIRNNQLGEVIEWVLHLPARGTIYVLLEADNSGAARTGELRAGTREFAGLIGSMSERWIAGETSENGRAGQVELVATYISRPRPQESTE